MLTRDRVFPLLVFASCALLAYTSFRAYRLSFVHDESLSFTIVTGAGSTWKGTANHHPLNTWLMACAYQWLGTREWQLRLPNVLSHVLYLACGLLLLRQVEHGASALLGFSLLNLNPFLLDFFSLARGYGLALGLSMLALLLLWRASRETRLRFRAVTLLLSLTCASLADLGNYTWLNLHLPLLAASALLVLSGPDAGRITLKPAALAVTAALTAANGWFILEVARRIWALKARGEIYGRGRDGFVGDTLGSLVQSYFYRQPYPEALKWTLVALAIAAFLVAALAVGYRSWRERRMSFSTVLLVVLLLALVLPPAERLLLGMEYPVERITL